MTRLSAIIALLAASGAGSIALLLALLGPMTPAAGLVSRLAPLPDASALAFNRNVVLAGTDPARRSFHLEAAEAAAAREITAAPLSADGYVRLASARCALTGQMTPAAADALARSYQARPIDPNVAPRRIYLVLAAYTAMEPSVRRSALLELRMLWSRAPSARPVLLQALKDVTNPLGRAAAQESLTQWGEDPWAA